MEKSKAVPFYLKGGTFFKQNTERSNAFAAHALP